MTGKIDRSLRGARPEQFHIARKIFLIAIGITFAAGSFAQSPFPSGKSGGPAFTEVYIQKSNRADPEFTTRTDAAGIDYVAIPLKEVLRIAYRPENGFDTDHLSNSIAMETRYDILARSEIPATKDQLTQMLGTLLEDQFKLRLHYESRPQSVYQLVVRKGGPTLQTTNAGPSNVSVNGRVHSFHRASMATLVKFLSEQSSLPIVDQTGLEGAYNFDLQMRWYDADNEWGYDPPYLPSLKKLGLQLKESKIFVKTLVIDKIESPSPN